jgi:hypothetical protein
MLVAHGAIKAPLRDLIARRLEMNGPSRWSVSSWPTMGCENETLAATDAAATANADLIMGTFSVSCIRTPTSFATLPDAILPDNFGRANAATAAAITASMFPFRHLS